MYIHPCQLTKSSSNNSAYMVNATKHTNKHMAVVPQGTAKYKGCPSSTEHPPREFSQGYMQTKQHSPASSEQPPGSPVFVPEDSIYESSSAYSVWQSALFLLLHLCTIKLQHIQLPTVTQGLSHNECPILKFGSCSTADMPPCMFFKSCAHLIAV